jgi:hypothetical protein
VKAGGKALHAGHYVRSPPHHVTLHNLSNVQPYVHDNPTSRFLNSSNLTNHYGFNFKTINQPPHSKLRNPESVISLIGNTKAQVRESICLSLL